jgi:hypothetical protein
LNSALLAVFGGISTTAVQSTRGAVLFPQGLKPAKMLHGIAIVGVIAPFPVIAL